MSGFEKLDETKSFDTVYGSSKGIKYHQDGKYFNGRKELVDTDGNIIVSEKSLESAPKKSVDVILATPRSKNVKVDEKRGAGGRFKSKNGEVK